MESGRNKELHRFNDSDGSSPEGALIFDAAGNLSGTTLFGGAYGTGCNCGGTVFKLTPGTNGKWKEKVVHSFGSGKDGAYPNAGLIFDAAGNLYGDTLGGGSFGHGTVFAITP